MDQSIVSSTMSSSSYFKNMSSKVQKYEESSSCDLTHNFEVDDTTEIKIKKIKKKNEVDDTDTEIKIKKKKKKKKEGEDTADIKIKKKKMSKKVKMEFIFSDISMGAEKKNNNNLTFSDEELTKEEKEEIIKYPNEEEHDHDHHPYQHQPQSETPIKTKSKKLKKKKKKKNKEKQEKEESSFSTTLLYDDQTQSQNNLIMLDMTPHPISYLENPSSPLMFDYTQVEEQEEPILDIEMPMPILHRFDSKDETFAPHNFSESTSTSIPELFLHNEKTQIKKLIIPKLQIGKISHVMKKIRGGITTNTNINSMVEEEHTIESYSDSTPSSNYSSIQSHAHVEEKNSHEIDMFGNDHLNNWAKVNALNKYENSKENHITADNETTNNPPPPQPLPLQPQSHHATKKSKVLKHKKIPCSTSTSSTSCNHSDDNSIQIIPPPLNDQPSSLPSSSSKILPSSMTTYQLLKNSNTLIAGLGLLSQLTSKTLSAQEISGRLGLPITTESKIKRQHKNKTPENSICRRSTRQKKLNNNNLPLSENQIINKINTINNNNNSNVNDENENENENENEVAMNNQREMGEALFRELINRNASQFKCENQMDILDQMLKPNSMTNAVPNYEEKNEAFKAHSEKICRLKTRSLTKHFKAIAPQIQAIFDDELVSVRHQLYLGGLMKRRELKELNVSIPFDNDQGTALFSLLFDLLVPDLAERPIWTDYINFVMLPESFIRIYGNVNNISYDGASTEMRFGPCYDGPLVE